MRDAAQNSVGWIDAIPCPLSVVGHELPVIERS